MFSARKGSFFGEKRGPSSRRDGETSPYSRLRDGFKPRVGMRVWLTVLFVLVTAFAAFTAYQIVRPMMEETLNRASQARFQEVGEQFERLLQQSDGQVSVQQIQSFAATRGLQWGIVKAESGKKLQGDRDLADWHPGVV